MIGTKQSELATAIAFAALLANQLGMDGPSWFTVCAAAWDFEMKREVGARG